MRIPLIALILLAPLAAQADPLSYNQHIRPILSDKCFLCHGPDRASRKADLRLDSFASATTPREDGSRPISPGQPDASELITRISSDDPDEVMPPADHPFRLKPRDIQLLTRWVAEGAEYEEHWSFIPPVQSPVPAGATSPNPIDAFVQARLRRDKRQPAPEADRATLLRRATLDLTGLPPTPEEVDALLADPDPLAYEHTIDRLLTSPRYGERMAHWWLDAARYADTDGYQNDAERTMWPWRDWVVKAYNDNLPFDQFTIQQLAGDMLPDATDMNRLASAFNRNHRLNNEGGALPEEFIVEYAIDRVETTFAVWQGLTVGCARCHDHKYDPVSQREFYQLFAYFNAIPEKGKAGGKNAPPSMKFGSPLITPDPAATAQAEAALARARAAQAEARAGFAARFHAWLAKPETATHFASASIWTLPPRQSATAQHASTLTRQADGSWLASGKNPASEIYTATLSPEAGPVSALRLEAMRHPSLAAPTGFARSSNGNFVLTGIHLIHQHADGRADAPIQLTRAEADYAQDSYPAAHLVDGNKQTGWAVHSGPAGDRSAIVHFARPRNFAAGDRLLVRLEHHSRFGQHNIGRFRLTTTAHPKPTIEQTGPDPALLAAFHATERSQPQRKQLQAYYRDLDPHAARHQAAVAAAQRTLDQVNNPSPAVNVMIMQEGDKPRPTYLLNRGQYDQPDTSEELQRDVPAKLTSPDSPRPENRLEFARWLVSPTNPLTARVTVNRIWQMHFGQGLVTTAEDFGLQGELPSHPELLDWLAVWFQQNGWDKKALHKLILTSATYRQHARVSAELLQRDPQNRLLARGPRYRLDPYALRDQALFVSGLLQESLGGPPVKPYQPAGLWNSLAANGGTRYKPDTGDKLYRRSLYTYWKRTVGPPLHMLFDGATREVCSIRSKVTNTPLQALLLMNEESFLEAARHLAARVHHERETPAERITRACRLATGHPPSPAHARLLADNLAWYQQHFTQHPDEAAAFLAHGASPRDAAIPVPEHAAYTALTHLLLNLDATITKE